jgi:prepilin-type N-terminal cleavage/methylation domain-containing protein
VSILKKMRRPGLSKGFTLVELLVVIAIIGVLATMLLLQLGIARAKVRDTKRIGDINQIRTAIEMYFDDNGGHYPVDFATAGAGLTKYMTSGKLPLDPTSGGNYSYASDPAAPVRYHLYTELENVNRPAFSADFDINSSVWANGSGLDASDPAITEICKVGYKVPDVNGTLQAGSDCIYDVGQK